MAVKVIGLDTAKHLFQVHGADATGRAVLRKRLRRSQVSDLFSNIPQCAAGMKASQGVDPKPHQQPFAADRVERLQEQGAQEPL